MNNWYHLVSSNLLQLTKKQMLAHTCDMIKSLMQLVLFWWYMCGEMKWPGKISDYFIHVWKFEMTWDDIWLLHTSVEIWNNMGWFDCWTLGKGFRECYLGYVFENWNLWHNVKILHNNEKYCSIMSAIVQ